MFHGVRAKAVHTHDARALIYGAPAARLARVKRVIHTQHGQNLGMTPRRLKLLRFAAKRTDQFVCVSRDAMRIAAEQGIAADRLRVIYNGIDIDGMQRFDTAEQRRLAAAAQHSVADRFQVRRLIEQYEQLYFEGSREPAGHGPTR